MSRKKTTRGPSPVEQALALVAWVRQNVPSERRAASGRTPLEQCLWYAAYSDAETLVEETTKHLAQSVMAGIGPYKTIKHLAEWLEGMLDCETLDDIHTNMKQFWGRNA